MTVNLSPQYAETLSATVHEPPKQREWNKRFSVPRQESERRITLRPYESFRDRIGPEKPHITYGYAALSREGGHGGCQCDSAEGRASPSPSIFSIYGDDPGPSTSCEQPVGAQADVFISSLGEKNRHLLKKFLENTPRQENQYFMWIKNHHTDKFTVVSIKTLENHLKSAQQRIRRVKWRHLSAERLSVYRYSLPVITYEKSKRVCDCVIHRKKMWLLVMWLTFILFICVVVVLGSLSPEDRMHPYLHYNASVTQITLQNMRNVTIG